jgi:outer membrane protein assembly factor BamD (BamD/ComL family)
VTDLEVFVSRYPRSPLTQNAYVERFRALAKLGQHARAARAAQRYLADYPKGFAREEAQELAVP